MSKNPDSPQGTLQTGDKMGTISAVILFIFTLITGGLTTMSVLAKTVATWDWSMFFLLFVPTIQGAISLLVYKLTGQQIQDNNILNGARESITKKTWEDKEASWKKSDEIKDAKIRQLEQDNAESKSRDRFYNGTLGVDEWLKKQFNTSFGLFPKNQSNANIPLPRGSSPFDEDADPASTAVNIVSNKP